MALMAAAGDAANDATALQDGDTRTSKCSRLFSDIRAFPATFWLVCVIITLFYNLVFPFLADANSFIMSKYGFVEGRTSTDV